MLGAYACGLANPPASPSLAIAQVTPYPWEDAHEVNAYVGALCARAARAAGTGSLVVAPRARPTSCASRAGAIRAGELLERPTASAACWASGSCCRSAPRAAARRRAARRHRAHDRGAADATRRSTSSTCTSRSRRAPRRSRCATPARSTSAPSTRRPSACSRRRSRAASWSSSSAAWTRGTASFQATRDLMHRSFPAHYQVRRARGATDARARRSEHERRRCASPSRRARSAPRCALFLRALRRLPAELDWEAVVFAAGGAARDRCAARCASACRFVEQDASRGGCSPAPTSSVAASHGQAPAPGHPRARARRRRGARRLAPAAPTRRSLDDGELGLLFEPGDVDMLAAQLDRAGRATPTLRARLRERAAAGAPAAGLERASPTTCEAVYDRLAARRHDDRGRARGPRAGSRTGRSSTSTCTCTRTTRTTARRRSRRCSPPRASAGLGAIAVTDHNEISGALAARERGRGVRRQGDRRRGGQDRPTRARSSACSSRRRSRAG